MEEKWRFPASNFGGKNGISNGDVETFKKNSFKSFGREILQNSIDARATKEKPTRVDFSIFTIKTQDIPGRDDLCLAMKRCIELWSHKPGYIKEYKRMLKILEEDVITCLRVSDFNTTGLIGVETNEQENNKFLALVKGSGVSEKNDDMAGGSKGIGKNAAFLLSSINTVFYFTVSNQCIVNNLGSHKGFMGVSKLVSGYVGDDHSVNGDYTQGTGYYGESNRNCAIHKNFNLDSRFFRDSRDGTDIYILGFNYEDDWENTVIISVLDSFMAAIVKGELEVNINEKKINQNTVEDLIKDDSTIWKTDKKTKKSIISQYFLLSNKNGNVKNYDIDTDYGKCELYIIPHDNSEEDLATNKCSMIRYPLMKIKDISLGNSFRVSSLCIINEGELGRKLRDIENAQHTDWEYKRIQNKTERDKMHKLITDITNKIKLKVQECLGISDNEEIDPNGAGDYLPYIDNGGDLISNTSGQKIFDKCVVSKPRENKILEKNANHENKDGNGIRPDIGEINDDINGDLQHPIGENDHSGAGRHPGIESSGEKEGGSIIFKRSNLVGVRYKVISTNKNEGIMRVIFVAPRNLKECYLNISLLADEINNNIPIQIDEMKCNGINIISKDRNEFGPFAINQNEKVILDIKTDYVGYFASEVKVKYAC